MTPPVFLLINGGTLAVGAVAGGLVTPPLALLGAIAGAIAPLAALRAAVMRAQARADREALVLLRLLGAHLRAGAIYIEALRAAAEGMATPRVRDDLAWIANRFRLDRPLHGSLAAVAARTPGRHLRLLYTYRLLTAAQIHALAFETATRRTCEICLRRLHRKGWVVRAEALHGSAGGGRSGYVYGLSA